MNSIVSGPPEAEIALPGALGAEARDWLNLLKPRVVSLVVFTGAAGLFIAPGRIHPFVAFIAILCIAVAAGAAGGDQHVVRPGHRCADASDVATADRYRPDHALRRAGLRYRAVDRVGGADVAGDQRGRGRRAGDLDCVLRVHLHDLVEALDAAEHRHRRGGRGVSADHRLGRCDRRYRRDAAGAVRDRVPVDAAALLGTVAVRLQGLRACRRADAPR